MGTGLSLIACLSLPVSIYVGSGGQADLRFPFFFFGWITGDVYVLFWKGVLMYKRYFWFAFFVFVYERSDGTNARLKFTIFDVLMESE